MGMDRTSIHKPEFCLPGQGWRIDQKTTVDLAHRRVRTLSIAGCKMDDHEYP